ncbi:hypothetical protein JW796_02055 [Candidatus Dojkabacteria bacterium]|nr:hypothetical protein [Candidatus Dojkabacteria bacterium]
MNVDEVVKLVYAFGITGSVVGVSIFLMRLLDRLTRRMDEMERITENVGEISEKVSANMDLLEESLEIFTGITRKLKYGLIDPLSEIFSLVRIIKGIIAGLGGREGGRFQKKKNKNEETDKNQEDLDLDKN